MRGEYSPPLWVSFLPSLSPRFFSLSITLSLSLSLFLVSVSPTSSWLIKIFLDFTLHMAGFSKHYTNHDGTKRRMQLNSGLDHLTILSIGVVVG